MMRINFILTTLCSINQNYYLNTTECNTDQGFWHNKQMAGN